MGSPASTPNSPVVRERHTQATSQPHACALLFLKYSANPLSGSFIPRGYVRLCSVGSVGHLRPKLPKDQRGTVTNGAAGRSTAHRASVGGSHLVSCIGGTTSSRLKVSVPALSPAQRLRAKSQRIRKVCNGNADRPFGPVALAGAPTIREHNSIKLLADVTEHKTTQMLYEQNQNPWDSITVLIFDQESYLAVFNITKPLYQLFIK